MGDSDEFEGVDEFGAREEASIALVTELPDLGEWIRLGGSGKDGVSQQVAVRGMEVWDSKRKCRVCWTRWTDDEDDETRGVD